MSLNKSDLHEVALKIANLLDHKYASYLGERFFTVSSENQGDTIRVSVMLATADESFYYPIEGQMEIKKNNLEPEDGLVFLCDYIDSYLEAYFQSEEEVYLPIDWAEFEHNGIRLFLKGQIFNKKLEKLADKILEGDNQSTN